MGINTSIFTIEDQDERKYSLLVVKNTQTGLEEVVTAVYSPNDRINVMFSRKNLEKCITNG